jgi:hypothetical protein
MAFKEASIGYDYEDPENEHLVKKDNVLPFKRPGETIEHHEPKTVMEKSLALLKSEGYDSNEEARMALENFREEMDNFHGDKIEKVQLADKISKLTTLVRLTSTQKNVSNALERRRSGGGGGESSGGELPPKEVHRPRKAGLLAKAVLAFTGASGAIAGFAVSHEIGYHQGKADGEAEAYSDVLNKMKSIDALEKGEPNDEIETNDEEGEKEIFLAPRIMSQEVLDKGDERILSISANANDRIYMVLAPMPKHLSGDLEFKPVFDILDMDDGTQMHVQSLISKTESGGEVRVAMTESLDGLEVTVIETDEKGNIIYQDDWIQQPGMGA